MAAGALALVAVVAAFGAGLGWARGWRPTALIPAGLIPGSPDASPSLGPGPAADPSIGVPGGSEHAVASSGPATPAPSPAVLVGAGDIGQCPGGGDRQTAAIVAKTPGIVMAVGDLAYDSGTPAEFRDCYGATWGAFKARTRPAAGNHDWMTPGLAGYLGYWGKTAVNAEGDPWYSFEAGAWHVVVLDSDCPQVGGCVSGSREDAWLVADLTAHRSRCIAALFHHPLFVTDPEPGDPDVFPVWERLYAAGAELVVNGHYHDYERFAPQDPTGRRDDARGIREFIVGTGGGPLRPFGQRIADNSEVRIGGVYGVLELTLSANSYAWRFVATDGSTRDTGSGRCH